MASNVHDIGALMQGLDGKSRDLIAKIVAHLKSQGNFDELRRDCLEELDKMEAFRQLNQRVESYVATFLSKQEWSDTLSKNQMRDSLRKHVIASENLKTGSQRLVTQVIEKKSRAFQSRLEGIVQDFIYKDKEKAKQERQARYQGKIANQQESSTSKSDQEKHAGISDVNDIISQIEHSESDLTKGESNIGTVKIDNTITSQHGTHPKGDTTTQLKSEQITQDRKTDISSPSDTVRQTPLPKLPSLNKKTMHSKRISKIGGSPRSSSPSEKPSSKSPSTTKHPKTTNENQTKSTSEALNTESTKSNQDSVKLNSSAFHETGQSSQETSEKENIVSIQDEKEQKPSVNDRDLYSCTVNKENKSTTSDAIKEIQEDIRPDFQETVEANTSETKPSDEDDAQDDCKQVESDVDDSVSDVSSVHTSDLSSFDDEISSVSDLSDDNTDSKQNTKNKAKKKKNKSTEKVEEKEKRKATSNPNTSGPRRKRGRPRKETYQDDKPEKRSSRTRYDSRKSTDDTHGRDKPKRAIKKKRCYSPSSEGSREVCLPSKRTRVNSRD